jgi:hypothetical protein
LLRPREPLLSSKIHVGDECGPNYVVSATDVKER